MPKNLISTALAVLWLSVASGPLPAAQPQQPYDPTVQTEGKADSRLVIEAPQMVETWIGKCTAAEKVKNPYAPMCWRNAATAVAEYAAGFESPMIEQLRRLPATWLQRAAQLQSPRLSPMGRPPAVKPPVLASHSDGSTDTVRAEAEHRHTTPAKAHAFRKDQGGQCRPNGLRLPSGRAPRGNVFPEESGNPVDKGRAEENHRQAQMPVRPLHPDGKRK